MFHNNLDKFGPITKIFHQLIPKEILCIHTTTIPTLPALCAATRPCKVRKSKNVTEFSR